MNMVHLKNYNGVYHLPNKVFCKITEIIRSRNVSVSKEILIRVFRFVTIA